ncbi:hypothetical protein [Wolbachia endosymbiont of Pentidionis agamae]|uniref:hypothetical protein n=1 Tax=Wolbachia endosymbiont of Pentidionis agamae TaxID=3110435 RepID=UPI002FD74525
MLRWREDLLQLIDSNFDDINKVKELSKEINESVLKFEDENIPCNGESKAWLYIIWIDFNILHAPNLI